MGRYEFELAQAAYEKGLTVCVVKPLRIRRYAQSMELFAKTDKLDAILIAGFAATGQPDITPAKSKSLTRSKT